MKQLLCTLSWLLMQRLDNVTLCQLLSGELYRLYTVFRRTTDEIYDDIGFRHEHGTCLFLMSVSLLCGIIQFICWTLADICTISKFAHWILFVQPYAHTHIHTRRDYRSTFPVENAEETERDVRVIFIFRAHYWSANISNSINKVGRHIQNSTVYFQCIRFGWLWQSFCLFCGNCINTM